MKKPTLITGLVVFAGLLAFRFFLRPAYHHHKESRSLERYVEIAWNTAAAFLPEERAQMVNPGDPLLQ